MDHQFCVAHEPGFRAGKVGNGDRDMPTFAVAFHCDAAFAIASATPPTRGALTGFSRGLVRELGPRGITVNIVHPGPTDSDMNPADGAEADFVRSDIAHHGTADWMMRPPCPMCFSASWAPTKTPVT